MTRNAIRTGLAAPLLVLVLGAPHRLTANPIQFPQLKEGLWAIHMVTTIQPGGRILKSDEKLCRSHAYDDYARTRDLERPGCGAVNMTTQGSGYSMEGDCTVQGAVMHIKANVRLIDSNHTHTEIHSNTAPPLKGVSDTTVVQDQTFVGACSAGTGPGDMTMGTGAVIHLWKR